jgi:hypothetical protein
MKYDKLPMEALKDFKKKMPESKVTAEYKQRISELGDNEIGHFTLSKGDVKAGTIKMRLLRAAESLGVDIEVKRFGDEVVFYKVKEAKESKTKGKK